MMGTIIISLLIFSVASLAILLIGIIVKAVLEEQKQKKIKERSKKRKY
jgi:uncharacterized BrkB/YihY/UPF0761 family membrane protein